MELGSVREGSWWCGARWCAGACTAACRRGHGTAACRVAKNYRKMKMVLRKPPCCFLLSNSFISLLIPVAN
jgi:hypothetical protein